MNFGPINVDHQGLSDSRQVIPWVQIGTVEVDQNKIFVRANGSNIRLKEKASEVANLSVLVELVRYITQRNQSQPPRYS